MPVVVAESQVAAPLVPVRFRLQAAAIAADEGDWDRAESMIRRAARELGQLQTELAGTPEAPEIDALARDVKRMSQGFTRGQRPTSDRIRELAARTRTIPSA